MAHIAWRPSRWMLAALALLTVLAGAGILASGLPQALAWPAAVLATGQGAWLLRREARRPPRHFVFRASGEAMVDNLCVEDMRVSWRGPLAFARWRGSDGSRGRVSWWPDTLPAWARRELRLAAPAGRSTGARDSMAP